VEGASFKALGARNERLGEKIRTKSLALTLIICFFRGFAPVGSLFLRLRRIAQWHQNVQFEINKTYAEIEGKWEIEFIQFFCQIYLTVLFHLSGGLCIKIWEILKIFAFVGGSHFLVCDQLSAASVLFAGFDCPQGLRG
jgi:hypothetical protein